MRDTFVWTLAHIRAMLWIYYSAEPLPDDALNRSLIATDLYRLGMIVERTDKPGFWEATEMGRAYCEAIRNVPLPTQVWVVRYPTQEEPK